MSFTDIRRFWTIMKELGYPHIISMESFRCPNFEYVANCLYWLITRYDPTIDLEKNISTENSRINFVQSATKIMLARAKIKLNAKHIYSADGYAVKELLKIATILQVATQRSTCLKNELPGDNTEVAILVKPTTKAIRVFVNELTKCGTTLYDMLNAEPKFKEQRDQTLMENRNMDEMEYNIKEAIEAMMTQLIEVDQEICHSEESLKVLRSKCEKRKLELEQCEKRLSSLQNVKPTYVDQYDEMQVHLHNLFSQYIEKFQNLKWLETQMETYAQNKKEKLNEVDCHMRQLQRSIQNEEISSFQDEDVNNDLIKNIESSEESEGERANIWNWFHNQITKTKKKKDLEASNMITNENLYNTETPLVQSNWAVYKLDKNRQEMPIRKSNKGHFTNKYCESFQTSPSKIEPLSTNHAKASVNNYEDSKFGGDETEDDLLDIDAATCNEGSDGDTSLDDF